MVRRVVLYVCEYCGVESESKRLIRLHEFVCPWNGGARTCLTCSREECLVRRSKVVRANCDSWLANKE